jgi:hypothetical protein
MRLKKKFSRYQEDYKDRIRSRNERLSNSSTSKGTGATNGNVDKDVKV